MKWIDYMQQQWDGGAYSDKEGVPVLIAANERSANRLRNNAISAGVDVEEIEARPSSQEGWNWEVGVKEKVINGLLD